MTNPTNQLTEAEAVEIVRERAGWTKIEWYEDDAGPGFWHGIPHISEEDVFKMPESTLNTLRKYGTKIPDYLNSRDALQPVLETMTPEEWMNLHRIINEAFAITQPGRTVGLFWGARATKHLLTLPARTLCLAVAAAIKESAK